MRVATVGALGCTISQIVGMRFVGFVVSCCTLTGCVSGCVGIVDIVSVFLLYCYSMYVCIVYQFDVRSVV